MATLDMVMSQLVSSINTELTDAGVITLTNGVSNATVGEGWPADDIIEDVRKGSNNLVSVVHRSTNNKKKFTKFRRAETDMPCGISSVFNYSNLPASDSSTLTISLSNDSTQVNVNDSVSLQVQFGIQSDMAVYVALVTDTLSTMATKLAATINTRTLLSTWISATASGAVVTITNKLSGSGLRLGSRCANLSNFNVTVGSALSQIQVTIWADTIADRYTLINPLQSFFAGFEGRWSFALATGENVSLKLRGSRELDADRQKDIFDWFFLLDIEYFVDVIDEAYRVLGTLTTIEQLNTDPSVSGTTTTIQT